MPNEALILGENHDFDKNDPKGIPEHANGFPHHQSATMPFSKSYFTAVHPCFTRILACAACPIMPKISASFGMSVLEAGEST